MIAARPAEGGGPVDDGVPSGTVAFFGSGATCPMGWTPADMVNGRLIVGVTEPTTVGRTVGDPLHDREDRTHTHGVTGSITLPASSIAGADGSNNQGAAAGMHHVNGSAAAATSGLPFVQLRACVKR